MNAFELLEAIGEIDERDVALARMPKSRKPLYIALGSVAACLVVLLMLPGIVMNLIGFGAADAPDSMAPEDNNMSPEMDNATDVKGELLYADVIGKDTAYPLHDPDTLATLSALLDTVTVGEGVPVSLHDGLLAEGEYRLLLTDARGITSEYLLRESSIVVYETRMSYSLTAEQAETVRALIGAR